MSDARFSLDQLRTAYRGASPDAALRVRQSDATQVTTAERGFGGRVVSFFRPDAEGNRAVAESLLRGLQQAYGDDVGEAAFRLVRGSVAGDAGFNAAKPITARQAREMDELARALSTEQRRDAAATGALCFGPDAPAFELVAADAGVDPSSLDDAQKELYRRLLQQRVVAEAGFGKEDATLPDGAALQRIAVATLAHVAAMDPQGVADAQARLAEQQFVGAALLKGLGSKDADPRALLQQLARFEASALASARDIAPEGVDAEALARSREIALDRVLADLTPAEARALYRQAMGPDGAGRALAFATAVQAHAETQVLGGDPLRPEAAVRLADSAAAVLAALGRRGGIEEPEAELRDVQLAARGPGDRIAQQPGGQGPVRLTRTEVNAAGITDRGVANAALAAAPDALARLERTLRSEQDAAPERARHGTMRDNLRAVRELVLDDTALEELVPGFAQAGPRARIELRALVMDQAKRDARDEFLGGGPIPRLGTDGVRQAVARAVQGNADAIAEILDRPETEDRLSPALLRGRLAPTVQRLMDFTERRLEARLLASSGDGASFDQQETRRLAHELARLPNTELLGHYRDIVSVEMLEFRLALQNDPHNLSARAALEGLDMFEALVLEEVAKRVLRGDEEARGPPGTAPVTDRQVATLTDIEKRAQKRDLDRQSPTYLEGNPAAPRMVAPRSLDVATTIGMPVEDLARALRTADLTINLPPRLFQPGGPFVDEQGKPKPEAMQLKNVFATGTKGEGYIERRLAIENLEMPTLKTLDPGGERPQDRPISAGINVGRNIGGAAPGYGACLVVLKDEVKQTRATFTAQDSFRAFTTHATPQGVAAMLTDLEARLDAGTGPKMTQQDWALLRQDLPEIRRRLEASASGDGIRTGPGEGMALPRFVGTEILGGLPSRTDNVQFLLFNLAVKHLGDPDASPEHVASFQRIDDILGDIANKGEELVLDGLAQTTADPLRVNAIPKGYIEAQVFGGIDLTRDVQEIRLAPDKLDAATIQSIKDFGTSIGVPVTVLDPQALQSPRLSPDETVKTDIGQVIPGTLKPRLTTSLDDFRASGRLEQVLDVYRAKERDFDPEATNGRLHVVRTMIFADVMANMIRERGGKVESDVLFTAVGLHDAGRTGPGPDVFEGASGQVARDHYVGLGVDPDADKPFLDHVAACIDGGADPSLRSLETMILKSADGLDSMRQTGPDGFDPDGLWFMHRSASLGGGVELHPDPVLREALLDEVAAFIDMTQPVPPSRAAFLREKEELAAARGDLEELKSGLRAPTKGRGIAEVEREIEQRSARLDVLREQVSREIQDQFAGLGSLDIYDDAVATLRANRDRLPLLNAYFQPGGGTQV